ncbi:hypothetical protein ZWY2020_024841 [Hordeum vulgare]|nr:hypothetical protein ZWY2020_024841 [Hordeum vulgare]
MAKRAGDDTDASHPFLDLLDAAFNAPSAADMKATLTPRRALTENCYATYANSGNPCLDFFFQLVLDTPAERLRSPRPLDPRPLMTLKLAATSAASPHRKSDKEGFYGRVSDARQPPQDARQRRAFAESVHWADTSGVCGLSRTST